MVKGPRELCVVRKSAVPLLYGPGTECRKSTWYSQVDTDGRKGSIHMERNEEEYKRRRKCLDGGFAIKGKPISPSLAKQTDLSLQS
jgi:hypothetical protein